MPVLVNVGVPVIHPVTGFPTRPKGSPEYEYVNVFPSKS